MSKMIQVPTGDVSVPRETAQAVQTKIGGVANEKPISHQALGLLVNLMSYPPTWELRKTELYKRYVKNRKTSVGNSWDELVEANYIVEFKYRVGRKFEYVYYYSIRPITEEQKECLLKEAEKEHGKISGLKLKSSTSENQQSKKEPSTSDFVQSKPESSKLDGKVSSLNQLRSFKEFEEEDNREARARDYTSSEKIVKAVKQYSSYQALLDFAPNMSGIFTGRDYKVIIARLLELECYTFTDEEIKSAYKKTVKNSDKRPSTYFSEVLSNEPGLAKINKIRLSKLKAQQVRMEQRDLSIYYNWLEEDEEITQ